MNILLKLPYKILLSTYPNGIYKKKLKHWKVIEYKSPTRRGVRTELLYMNFDNKEGKLHDYRYLGKDFRERERIKKKIKRWNNKLIKLPITERNAIIEMISQHQK